MGQTPRGIRFPEESGHTRIWEHIEDTARSVDAALDGAVPAGVMVPFAGPAANIPDGWLVCDGRAVSRSTYAALFAAIGTGYGVGDGSTTFNVPSMMVGRTVIGADATSPHGTTGGARTHTLTVNEMPSHGHGWVDQVTAANNIPGTGGLQGSQATARAQIASTGGGQPHNNMPPFIAMQWIIRT